jgi:ABC-type transport system substrate-binding protein
MTRGSDGFFLAPGGEPFRLEVAALSGSMRENEVFVDGYRRAGIDAFTYVMPLAQASDNQLRALRPGLARSGLGARALSGFVSTDVPRPENRWGGNIRGGWSSPEYDRLWRLYDTTLNPDERTRYVGEMEHLIAEEVAGIPSFFTVTVNAHTSEVTGVVLRMTPDGGFGLQRVDRWEWTS